MSSKTEDRISGKGVSLIESKHACSRERPYGGGGSPSRKAARYMCSLPSL